ncbi:hypothetical protein VDGD_21424 [Verticillium dahliae]|nr:hypothetical protein VDGD_21424 [Verticillium dahliae]
MVRAHGDRDGLDPFNVGARVHPCETTRNGGSFGHGNFQLDDKHHFSVSETPNKLQSKAAHDV